MFPCLHNKPACFKSIPLKHQHISVFSLAFSSKRLSVQLHMAAGVTVGSWVLCKLSNIGTEQALSAGQQEEGEHKTMRGFNWPSFILL